MDYIGAMMFTSRLSGSRIHRAVHDPDLGLEGSFRNRFELHQEHVVKVHKALTNFPMSGGDPVHGVRALWFGLRQC